MLWLTILMLTPLGLTTSYSPFPRNEDLKVFLPEWKPRERRQRAGDWEWRAKGDGVVLDELTKKYGRQSCPDSRVMEPCKCKSKTSGLDITCDSIDIIKLQKLTARMKEINKNKHKEFLVSYFKIRNSRLGILPDYIFMGLKIVHLLIYNSKLSSMSPNSLSTIAPELKHLILSNNDLNEVPTKAMRQLSELDHLNLNQNNISVLADSAFWGLKKATRISLYDNKIKEIHASAFDGLERLQNLPIIQTGKNAKDLLRLNLGRNLLYVKPPEALRTLRNLNQLDMSENKLSKLGGGDFIGLNHLDTLKLNHNIITDLGAGSFDGLPKLTSLSLDYNKIQHIDKDAFVGLGEELQSLSLASNKIQLYPSFALVGLMQLTTLHLDDNHIESFEEDAFQDYGEHIKNLWLQNNHISEIPQNAFQDLHSVEWLQLYGNQLTTLHFEVMEPILDTLKHIDIHGNPLVCDCELRWYKKWYESEWQTIDTDYIKDTHCIDPEDQRDHKMSDVDLSHMFCAVSPTGTEPGKAVRCHGQLYLYLLISFILF